MPIKSKYDSANLDQLIGDLIDVLIKHRAPVDLQLMALGNLITNIINEQVPVSQRQQISQQFAQVLLQSVSND